MAKIRFSQTLHYISKDNIARESYDEETLKTFLKHAMHFFRMLELLIRKNIANCRDITAAKRLKTPHDLARYAHKRLKSSLPHLRTAQELFAVAEEFEGLLHYITADIRKEVCHFRQPFQTCLQDELLHIEDRITDHCERAVTRMGSQISKTTSTVQ